MEKPDFRLAIIGGGQWGINYVRTALTEFSDVKIFVCDINKDNQSRVVALSEQVVFTTDIFSILDNPKISAVVIATPTATHYNIAKQCLQAGKHILVEKPVTLFSKQAEDLKQLALQKQKHLLVGHLLLFHPAIRKIKELIDENRLGKLQYIYSNRLNLGTVRKEENILWSFAPHDISILDYLIDKVPISVEAKGSIFLQPGIHDVTVTTLSYPENIQAHIHVSWLHPFKEHRLVVIGDKSMVVFEGTKNQLTFYPKGIDNINGEIQKRESQIQNIEYSKELPLNIQLKHFRNCVEQNSEPFCGIDNGIKILKILEQAQESLNQKKTNHEFLAKYTAHETAVVDENCDIGEGTKIWHFSHVQSFAKIGKYCTLGQNVNIANNVSIGNYVKIQNNVSVYEGVELEDYVFCGPSMVFTNILYPRCEFPQRGSKFYQKTLVQYGSSIGANSTIVCGVTIGRFAFIGAGSVVTKNVPNYALVLGNPGRIVGWVCRCGQRLNFSNLSTAHCKCNNIYHKENDRIIPIQESKK